MRPQQSNKYGNLFEKYRNTIDSQIERFLSEEIKRSATVNYDKLYEPVHYIMSRGGKRIRPILLILSCVAFGGNAEAALDAAAAVEMLHNFTLVHDDIMDNASSRRGRETVHKKWDVNTAILAGDELMALSYKSLLRTRSPGMNELVRTFTEGIIEICEGQAMDKIFESENEVRLDAYILMVKKKTAAMMKLSAQSGAIISGTDSGRIESIGQFAENIGIAFQIRDDLLDVYSTKQDFGKTIGGDIRENKKTFLYLKALETADDNTKQQLKNMYREGKVEPIIDFYMECGVIQSAESEIEHYTQIANRFLNCLDDHEQKEILETFSNVLLNRSS